MKRQKRSKCPLGPAEVMICVRPREETPAPRAQPQRPIVTVTRTEKRSWIGVAVTGFGALLVRYYRIVREHGSRFQLIGLVLLLIIFLMLVAPTPGALVP